MDALWMSYGSPMKNRNAIKRYETGTNHPKQEESGIY